MAKKKLLILVLLKYFHSIILPGRESTVFLQYDSECDEVNIESVKSSPYRTHMNMVSLHEFCYGIINAPSDENFFCNECIHEGFLLCVTFCGPLDEQFDQRIFCSQDIHKVFLQYEREYDTVKVIALKNFEYRKGT